MANKAPIDGYVDPAIPNPNGVNDAPIIIYGYDTFAEHLFIVLSIH